MSERTPSPDNYSHTHTQKHIIPCADYSKSMCSPLLAASLSVRRRRRIHFAIRTLKERRRSNYRHCCQIRWQSANPLLIAAKGLLRPRLHQAAQRRIAGASRRTFHARGPSTETRFQLLLHRDLRKTHFFFRPHWVSAALWMRFSTTCLYELCARCGTCKIKSPSDRPTETFECLCVLSSRAGDERVCKRIIAMRAQWYWKHMQWCWLFIATNPSH